MRRSIGAAAARSQVSQDAGGQRQVAAHVAGQRVQHVAVHQRWPHVAFAQQGGQVVDVPAESREFGAGGDERGDVVCAVGAASSAASVKLSIRMTLEEASLLAAGARAAGLSRGAYLSGLIANVPVLASGGNRTDHIATLVASSAELSTLSRNIHHLTSLLREGNVRPALVYRDMLDTLAGDVRRHLMLAASVLADLRPRSRSSDASTRPTP